MTNEQRKALEWAVEFTAMRASENYKAMSAYHKVFCELLSPSEVAASAQSSDALYTLDQMRDYAEAFHKTRLDGYQLVPTNQEAAWRK